MPEQDAPAFLFCVCPATDQARPFRVGPFLRSLSAWSKQVLIRFMHPHMQTFVTFVQTPAENYVSH